MIGALLIAVSLGAIASVTNAECANACNGHGKCTSYDMCICNRNWQAADCSERVCMFGLAHVDTPKGDLNMDGVIEAPGILLVDNAYAYPFGTTEQFPQMQDSDRQTLEDSAHYYMECSNKGKCDRTTGECQCYDGYDGVACQRASCPGYPNSCSGHGVCMNIEQLAADDHKNVYKLWDREATMGCKCDAGYSGPDCSQRDCKSGVDPLYLDDVSTVKYSIFDFATLTTKQYINESVGSGGYLEDSAFFTNGESVPTNGHWAIRFFDTFGEDWITEPIPGGATCEEVETALYNLPNDVIPSSSLHCSRTRVINGTENTFSLTHPSYDSDHPEGSSHPYELIYKLSLWEARLPNNEGELSVYAPITVFTGSNDTKIGDGASTPKTSLWLDQVKISGFIYRLKFLGNPGALRSPEIEVYLDGKRPSLVTPGGKVITKVWTDGQQGEYNDYFADHCDGVTVTIQTRSQTANGGYYGAGEKISWLSGLSYTEKQLLKKCLGGSDFDSSNNVDVYNWDYGSKLYPHIVKLVRTVTTYTDGGYYAVLWYDANTAWDTVDLDVGTFRLLNPFIPPDAFLTDNYDVYTTTGTLALTSNFSEATFGFASNYIYMTNVTYDLHGYNSTSEFDGDISCEVGANNAGKFHYIFHCLNHSDMFTVLNWEYPQYNPPNINLYSAARVATGDYLYSVEDRFKTLSPRNTNYGQGHHEMHYMTHYIETDIATNWAASVGNWTSTMGSHGDNALNNYIGKPQFHVYKFFPASASTYNYVAECSNRGLCDNDMGTCNCFPGYTNDDCSVQSSLAV